MSGPRSSVEVLPVEICVELFAQLPQVADKLRLAAASRAFWKASLDSRAWETCHTGSLPNPESHRTQANLGRMLATHAQQIRHLHCSSLSPKTLLVYQTMWQFLPRLRLLWLHVPLSVIQGNDSFSFELPSSLQDLMLELKQTTGTKCLEFQSLQTYRQQLKLLHIDASRYEPAHCNGYVAEPRIVFSDADLPVLDSLHMLGPHRFNGCLRASSLLVIHVANPKSGISWQHFQHCQRLEEISLQAVGTLDFTECTSLTSMSLVKSLHLEAGSIEEAGIFSGLQAARLEKLWVKVSSNSQSSFSFDHLQADARLQWKFGMSSTHVTAEVTRG